MADEQIQNQGQPEGQVINNQVVTPDPNKQVGIFDELKAKKGWKDNDAVAKSYTEIESEAGRRQTIIDNAKKNLEAQGVTLDDKGNLIYPTGQPYQQPTQQSYGQPYGQPSYGQPEPVYDPYTGQQLTNPIDIQLAQLPPSQRTAVVVNAIVEQREKFQSDAFINEQEILSKPEAKGFEEDVRKVMMQVPLQYRADKKQWENALLRVKGARYDSDRKNWSQQGVDEFINKEGNQNIGEPSTVGTGGVKLTTEQEQTWQYYKTNYPSMFKDKAHFLRATKPDGGR